MSVRVVTPDQVPQLLAEMATTWRPTKLRDLDDVVALDGNHYTLQGDCEGCLRLRGRVVHLEDAVSELQDLFSDALAILSSAGLIAPETS